MNVNEKGVKGLLKVMDDLYDKGFYVFTTFDDYCPIDLIAVNKNGHPFRLQVKYRNRHPKKKSEKYSVNTDSVVNGVRVPIDRTLIDGWAVYLAQRNKVIYLPISVANGKKDITIDPEVEYGNFMES